MSEEERTKSDNGVFHRIRERIDEEKESLLPNCQQKRFLQSYFSLVAIFPTVFSLSASFYILTDISPRPTSAEEVDAIEGFNLDLSLSPGHTIGKMHQDDIFYAFALAFIVALAVTAILAAVQKYRGEFLQTHPIATPLCTSLLFTFLLLFVLELGPETNYYPKPALAYNQTTSLNESVANMSFDSMDSRGTGLLSRHANILSLMFVFMEFVIVAIFTAIYNQKLVPDGYTQKDDAEKYFRLHSQMWWRYTQVILSTGVAIVVGLGVPLILEITPFGRQGILSLILILVAPLIALLIFSLAKLHFISEYLVENNLLTPEDCSN